MTFWTLSGLKALATSESGGDPTVCNVSGHCGLYQYDTATWKDFAPGAGVDLKLYPTADLAPASLQTAVALRTPISHWTCPDCNSQAAGFAATPGYTSLASGTLADGLADQGTGFRLSSSSAPSSAVGSDGLTIEMVDPGTGTGPSTSSGGTDTALPDAGTPQAVGLQPGLAKDLQTWITGAEAATGKAFKGATSGWLAEISDLALRGFLIFAAVAIAAVALWRLTESGGPSLANALRT